MGLTTGFKNSAGKDIGSDLVEKSYLIDRYPELADTFRFAGLWMWGRNTTGQLGDNSITLRSSPIQTVSGGTNWKNVTGVANSSAGVKTDGTLWTWGHNGNGQLGTGSGIVHRSSPVQTASGGTNWKLVAGGFYHIASIKTDGTLWTWGRNNVGQLGDGSSITHRSSPIQTVSGGTNWKSVAGGTAHTAAVKTDGTLWTWGFNSDGQLGNNVDTTNRSSPIQTVSGGTNWKQVACGGSHTAAIKTDGTLWLWGNNNTFDNKGGNLGDNSLTKKSSPVQTVSGGTNWKLVAGGFYHTAAIKTDGTLWLWGSNSFAQLGDNSLTPKSSPVQTVSGGTNWKSVACGQYHTAAIKTDGTLWLWGNNFYGILGDNTAANKSSPVQTVSGGTNWKQVSSGTNHIVSIRDNSSDIFGESV